MESAMQLQMARVNVALRAMPAVDVTPLSPPRRWPVFLFAVFLTAMAVILNATLVGAVLGVPLFLFALSLLTV